MRDLRGRFSGYRFYLSLALTVSMAVLLSLFQNCSQSSGFQIQEEAGALGLSSLSARHCEASWSACSKSCGGGVQTYEILIYPGPGGRDCEFADGFQRACNIHSCGESPTPTLEPSHTPTRTPAVSPTPTLQPTSTPTPSVTVTPTLTPTLTESEIRRAIEVSPSDLQCLSESSEIVPVSTHLEYFGILPGMGEDNRNFESWKQIVLPTLKMGNLVTIEILRRSNDAETVVEFKKQLDFVLQYRKKVALSVASLYFGVDGLPRSEGPATFSKIADLIRTYPANSVIAAYPFDEPYWFAKRYNISTSVMTANLTRVVLDIKTKVPGIKTVFIEAYPMIDDSLVVPPDYDWVGADCYLETCEVGGQQKTIREIYETLKTKMASHQKLIVIPTAMVFKASSQVTTQDSIWMKNEFMKYANWMMDDPKIAASISFLYAYRTINSGGEILAGAESSCHSRDVHRLFWKRFSSSALTQKTTPQINCTYSGSLESWSLSVNVTPSTAHVGLPGNFFLIAHDSVRGKLWSWAGPTHGLIDTHGDVNQIRALPVGNGVLISNAQEEIGTNLDVRGLIGATLYLGYGYGTSVQQSWQNVNLNPDQFKQCFSF